MEATSAEFAGAAGQVPSSVAAVIVLIDGEPFGTTIGSLVVISWSPPLIGVLARNGSRLERAIADAGRFTVSILAEDQMLLAGRLSRSDRPAGWQSFHGHELVKRDLAPPVVAGSVAWFDGLLTSSSGIGDHTLLIGHVIESARNPTSRPLSYYRGRWQRLMPPESFGAQLPRTSEQPILW